MLFTVCDLRKLEFFENHKNKLKIHMTFALAVDQVLAIFQLEWAQLLWALEFLESRLWCLDIAENDHTIHAVE